MNELFIEDRGNRISLQAANINKEEAKAFLIDALRALNNDPLDTHKSELVFPKEETIQKRTFDYERFLADFEKTLQGVKLVDVADQTGLHKTTIYRIRKGQIKLSESYISIASFMGVLIDDYFC